MQSLAELGEFLGIPAGSLELARIGGSPDISLDSARSLVTWIPREQRSLRAMIDGVRQLPEVTLTAELTGPRSGGSPLVTEIAVSPAPIGTWWTTLRYEQAGRPMTATELRPEGGRVRTDPLGPGAWTLAVERAGLGPSGPAARRVEIRVTSSGGGGGGGGGGGAAPPVGPTCDVAFVTFQGNTRQIRVYGSGFVGGEKITIVVDGADSTTTHADGLGRYSVLMSVLVSFPEVNHTYQARGASGRTSPVRSYKA